MVGLDYNIIKKYNKEWDKIKDILDKLENNQIYYGPGKGEKQHGYLSTNAKELRSAIQKLIFKIQEGQKSDEEEMFEDCKKHGL